jgi:hypothetical protein
MSSKTQSEFASKILVSKRRLPWNLRCLYTIHSTTGTAGRCGMHCAHLSIDGF